MPDPDACQARHVCLGMEQDYDIDHAHYGCEEGAPALQLARRGAQEGARDNGRQRMDKQQWQALHSRNNSREDDIG